MVKVANKGQSVIWIRDKSISPGEIVELTKEELNMSGVKALLGSKELEIVKDSKESKAKKDEK